MGVPTKALSVPISVGQRVECARELLATAELQRCVGGATESRVEGEIRRLCWRVASGNDTLEALGRQHTKLETEVQKLHSLLAKVPVLFSSRQQQELQGQK